MSDITTLTLICGDEVFLVKRSEDVDFSNNWACPGGSVDDGETSRQGALREFWEETKVDLTKLGISADSLRSAPSYIDADGELHFHYAIISPEQKEKVVPQLNFENSDAGWIKIGELPKADEIHANYITALNYLIKWEIDPHAVPIGKRPGLDLSLPGSEEDNREISAAATRIYDEILREDAFYLKGFKLRGELLEQLLPEFERIEKAEEKAISEYLADLGKVRNAYRKISALKIEGNQKNLAELIFGDEMDSYRYSPSSVKDYLKNNDRQNLLKIEGNGKWNFFKSGLKKQMAEASLAIEEIEQLAIKYKSGRSRYFVETAFSKSQNPDSSEFVYSSFVSEVKTNSQKEKRDLVDKYNQVMKKETHDRMSLCVSEYSDSAKIKSEITACHERVQNGLEFRYRPANFDIITREGLCFMEPEKQAGFMQALENSGFKLATSEERHNEIARRLREKYRENPLAHELNILPQPTEGKSYVFHGSSHLFHMPSEEYITRPSAAGPKGRGSQFDGIGFYTTTSIERVVSYEGGSSSEKENTKLVNGVNIYVYEIELDEKNILFEQKGSAEQNTRIDEALAKRGTSLAELVQKHDIKMDKWRNPGIFAFNENGYGNPLFMEYGAAGTVEILKEVGLTCATSSRHDGHPADRVVFNIPQLKPVARIEKYPAASVAVALEILRPHLRGRLNELEPNEMAFEYLQTAKAYNHDVLTNYHINNLTKGLKDEFNLSDIRAKAAIGTALERLEKQSGKTLEIEDVYFLNNKRAEGKTILAGKTVFADYVRETQGFQLSA